VEKTLSVWASSWQAPRRPAPSLRREGAGPVIELDDLTVDLERRRSRDRAR